MKYTMSKDGIKRTNIWIGLRIDKEEVKRLTKLAEEDGGMVLKDWLADCLRCGMWAAEVRLDEDRAALAERGGVAND
jgi:hypothetical protein